MAKNDSISKLFWPSVIFGLAVATSQSPGCESAEREPTPPPTTTEDAWNVAPETTETADVYKAQPGDGPWRIAELCTGLAVDVDPVSDAIDAKYDMIRDGQVVEVPQVNNAAGQPIAINCPDNVVLK